MIYNNRKQNQSIKTLNSKFALKLIIKQMISFFFVSCYYLLLLLLWLLLSICSCLFTMNQSIQKIKDKNKYIDDNK